MKKLETKIWLTAFLMSFTFMSCDNQWDDHTEIDNPALTKTVLEVLAEHPGFSIFHQMVVDAGYSELLNSDNSFTLLVPNNEVLAAYSGSSKEEKTAIVRNHIAWLSYNATALDKLDKLSMINGKNLSLNSLSLNTSNRDRVCANGIIHEVDKVTIPAMNIYEYLETLESDKYIQVDSLMGQTKKVMDMEKSVRIGVNDEGQTVYDTAWTYTNPFLEKIPLMNEDSLYTFVLIEDESFTRIAGKYAKYMKKGNQQKTDSIVAGEILGDMIFKPGNDEMALSGVKVDFSRAQVVDEYQASNGVVRIMKNVAVKIKENKIKSTYIQGEFYTNTLSDIHVMTRMRSWASGGMDVMLSGMSRQSRTYTDDEGNLITVPYNFSYEPGAYSNAVNNYIEYDVPVHSVNYNIYWVTYDDIPAHVGTDGYPESTLYLQQKLFISLPEQPKLSRAASGTGVGQISNNYLGNTMAFAAGTLAGVHEEVQLRKYNLTNTVNAFLVDAVEDAGNPQSPFVFSSSLMGKATFWVCNTTKDAGTYSGMMFLDYIRLTPIIDDED